jgi:hypothetical protein
MIVIVAILHLFLSDLAQSRRGNKEATLPHLLPTGLRTASAIPATIGPVKIRAFPVYRVNLKTKQGES